MLIMVCDGQVRYLFDRTHDQGGGESRRRTGTSGQRKEGRESDIHQGIAL